MGKYSKQRTGQRDENQDYKKQWPPTMTVQSFFFWKCAVCNMLIRLFCNPMANLMLGNGKKRGKELRKKLIILFRICEKYNSEGL